MKKNVFISLFVAITLALVVVSITLANCLHANYTLRKVVKSQAAYILSIENDTPYQQANDTYCARIVKPSK